MFDDPERYEHNGFYEEDTDYEGEYETDYSDYIVDDEENENVLWVRDCTFSIEFNFGFD